MRRQLVLWALGLMTALSACGGSPPPPKPVAAPPKPVSAPPKPPAPVAAAPAAPAPAPAGPASAAPKRMAPLVAAKPAAKAAAPAPPPPATLDPTSMAQALTTMRFRYDSKGRRDPFDNIETRIKEAPASISVTATKLTAIVRGKTKLALVEDAKGVGYILKPGDTLGDGRVVEIGEDSVVFAVTPKPGSTANRVVLTITAD